MQVNFRIALIFLASALFAGTAFSQNVEKISALLSPETAEIDPGQGIQFDLNLFDENGAAVDFSRVAWHLSPDSIASITEDGFFQAGKTAGEVEVVATLFSANASHVARARVIIGKPIPPEIVVVVSPQNKVVAPGGEQKYSVVAVARNNKNFRIEHIRWAVEPKTLGKINQDGIFYAAEKPGQGSVIAIVDVVGGVFHGRARVTVSEKPTSSIGGQVADDAGMSLAGAVVTVERLGKIRWGRRVKTDSLGSYTAGKLIPGLYVVKADARGYLAEYYDNKEHLSEANPIQLPADSAVSGVDFMLGMGAAVAGQVVADSSGAPIAQARVTAIHVISKHKRHAISDDDGVYEIGSLKAGDYAILANAAGYKSEFFDDKHDLLTADLISLTPPNVVDMVDFSLATRSAIAGKVFDANEPDAPLARAKILIYTLLGKKLHHVFTTTTNENGEYIANVPQGFYLVHASAKGYCGEFYDDVAKILLATPVQVFKDEHTTDIDFGLEKRGSISGVVTDAATGDPIEGALVTAFFEKDKNTDRRASDIERHVKAFQARTNAAGEYLIENVIPGEYYVRANARDYLLEFYQESASLANAAVAAVEKATDTPNIDFTLDKGGVMEGVISDSTSGAPLAGAVVLIWSKEANVERHTVSDQNGAYRFGGLPESEYIVLAKLSGYKKKFYDDADHRDEATPVFVASGAAVGDIDIALPKRKTRRGQITGAILSEVVTDDDSTTLPLSGAFVIAIPTKPGPAHFDFSDVFGTYRINNLPPGKYIVASWAPKHLGEFYDDVFHARNATRIEVSANGVVSGIDFALRKARKGLYRVRGLVRLKSAKSGAQLAKAADGVEGAMVYAFNDEGVLASTFVDENGEFNLSDLPAGEYKLGVSGVNFEGYFGGNSEENAQLLGIGNGQEITEVEIDAGGVATSIGDGASGLPTSFRLEQNFPNPFNPETTIRFSLPNANRVTLRVYNVMGQMVRTLVNEKREAGVHEIIWNGALDRGGLAASGIYFLKIETADFTATRRMVLLK